HGEQTEAVRTIAALSDLLRLLLDEQRPDELPLRDEVAFVRRYLEIERVRFPDRLDVEVTVDEAVLDAQVPTLILQPLVENAIRHGIARRSTAGRVAIAARRVGDGVELEVRDDGPRLAPDLVLLDVEMPELDGFDVIRTVGPDHMPAVVFVTAYDRFAVRAFDVNALDYLVKPFDDDRFRAAMDRAKRALATADAGDL